MDYELDRVSRDLLEAGKKKPDDPDGPVLRWLCRMTGRLGIWLAKYHTPRR